VDDATIFHAVSQVLGREGPAKLTLGRIAKVAGLAAPTLVQRFGSKLGLLREMTKAFQGGSKHYLAQLKAEHASPLTQSREFVLCYAGMAATPQSLVNHTLAYLQVDLKDPVLRRHTLAMGKENEDALTGLLAEAVAAGELSNKCKPRDLAQVLLRLSSGSLLAWAVHQTGTAREWLARDVDYVLAPYRVGVRRA
jgi:AcrR family transcriptional regulator